MERLQAMNVKPIPVFPSEETCGHCDHTFQMRRPTDICPECGGLVVACNACADHSNCGPDCVNGSRFTSLASARRPLRFLRTLCGEIDAATDREALEAAGRLLDKCGVTEAMCLYLGDDLKVSLLLA